MAGLVDAFDAENAGNFAYIRKDSFELALVGNFEVGVDARVGAIGAAFEVVDVGAGSADDGSDFGENAGAIPGTNGKLHGEGGFGSAAPLDGDAALGLVHEILDVGAHSSVHGDAAAAGDVADDFVPRNGIAALGAVYEQVVVALHDQGRFAESQHALDALDEGGPSVQGLGFRGFFRFSEKTREHLPSGIFSEANGGVEILHFRKAIIGSKFEDVGFGNFLDAAAEVARFVFEQALAHFPGFFAFLLLDPVTDLALRRARLHKAHPVAARLVALLVNNLNHITAADFMTQRHHLAINLRAGTLMPHFGVHHVSKIYGRGAARKLQHAAFGRKRVNLHGREIHFQRGEKFSGFLKFLRPFDELAHPGEALAVFLRSQLSGFVFPVRGNALLREAVHFLGADLHLEGLAAVEHGGMQRLV